MSEWFRHYDAADGSLLGPWVQDGLDVGILTDAQVLTLLQDFPALRGYRRESRRGVETLRDLLQHRECVASLNYLASLSPSAPAAPPAAAPQAPAAAQTLLSYLANLLPPRNSYGKNHFASHGRAKDLKGARESYRMAAGRELPFAHYEYGTMLRDAEGGPADPEGAREQFRLEAAKGSGKARVAYGQMLQAGAGGPVNEVAALYQFKLAAALGTPGAQAAYDALLGITTARH